MKRLPWMSTLAIALAAGCGTEPPNPRTIRASLVVPEGPDGAVQVRITGPEVRDVRPVSDQHVLFWRRTPPSETMVIVVGTIDSGPLFMLDVVGEPDPSSYAATVVEGARETDELRDDLTDYEVTLSEQSWEEGH